MVNKILEKHRALMESKIAQTDQLRKEIDDYAKENEEIITQIIEDAKTEEQDIEKSND
jgi:hypothetical protein